jgi:hypothetical protein
MSAIRDLPAFFDGLTNFKFIAKVVEYVGEFDDLGHGVFSEWLLRGEDGSQVGAVAMNEQQEKFDAKIQVEKDYVFCNGVFCNECGEQIVIDEVPAACLYVLTSKSKVIPATDKNRKDAIPLAQLVERVEFRAFVAALREVDRKWDPKNPTFVARLRDSGKMRIQIQATGTTICDKVYPTLMREEELVFRGGYIKMDYAPKSLRIEWTDKTTLET